MIPKHVIALFIVFFISGCANMHNEAGHTGADSTVKSKDSLQEPPVHVRTRAEYARDSLENERLHASLIKFYRDLISNDCLTIDTSWYKNVDSDYTFSDYYISLPVYGDDPPLYVDFPLGRDLKMTYNSGNKLDYFRIKGQKIPERQYTGHNKFPVSSMHRFSYKGGKYLVFTGGLSDFNGYGGRIQFNYFFDLTDQKIVADMYQNYWGWVDDLFLYGDLNNDNYLDRIRFDGIGGPTENEFDTVTFYAETYKNHKWTKILDESGNPYFIKAKSDWSFGSIAHLEEHWMKPVKYME